MKRTNFLFLLLAGVLIISLTNCEPIDDNPDDPDLILTYPIVDTDQITLYDNFNPLTDVIPGDAFYGQDAHFSNNLSNYQDNGDGTVSDLITGLMWQKNPGEKKSYQEAVDGAGEFNLGGFTDWRLPTIKELYSLILFEGIDPSGPDPDVSKLVPFIDHEYFEFEYGDESQGDRLIDAQYISSTEDIGDSQFGDGDLIFGVNFADGRIKGYPRFGPPNSDGKMYFVLYVRENVDYGINHFEDNLDNTITDHATGLMWMQNDSEAGMSWQEALAYSQGLELAGHTDWRLPNVKELQSIVDYTRAPGATNSAAIDPLFTCTEIVNEAGQVDYPFYWTGTTHASIGPVPGGNAAYISFGRAMGYGMGSWTDVHGAGAQRSDPKIGDPNDYPTGHGPQGDAIRIYNYVRCVRTIGNADRS